MVVRQAKDVETGSFEVVENRRPTHRGRFRLDVTDGGDRLLAITERKVGLSHDPVHLPRLRLGASARGGTYDHISHGREHKLVGAGRFQLPDTVGPQPFDLLRRNRGKRVRPSR